MINLYIVIAIVFTHWFADFFMQTDWMARNKSKSMKALTCHASVYAAIWLVVFSLAAFIFNLDIMIAVWSFTLITFSSHWLTDYVTSKITSKLWAKGDIHNFFVVVGFDQFLHYSQLFLTFYMLSDMFGCSQ